MSPRETTNPLTHERDAVRDAQRRAQGAEIRAAMGAHPAQQSYDDGLVHSHNWACGDRGRPSH
ncbi:MAG: hypothetical protein K2X11_11455 [Acetobacteraceae bacterium]|nr:hypothetical protein [Acetobacteraceae bacterium]